MAKAVRLVRALPEASEMCERLIARLDETAPLEARVRARVDSGRILGALHQFEAAREKFGDAERIAAGKEVTLNTANNRFGGGPITVAGVGGNIADLSAGVFIDAGTGVVSIRCKTTAGLVVVGDPTCG